MNPATWSEPAQWLLVLAYVALATALFGGFMALLSERRTKRRRIARLRAFARTLN